MRYKHKESNGFTVTSLCRCGDISTYQVSPADATSREEKQEEEVRKHLNLPLSPAGDVTVECVASNHIGVARHVLNYRKY